MNALRSLPLMKLKLSSRKWSVTTSDTLQNVLRVMPLKHARLELLIITIWLQKSARVWMHATQLDLVLLLTSLFSIMKFWTNKRKLLNLEKLLFLTLLRRLMMLMRRPSEMLNPSLNFLKKTFLSGKKKKSKTPLKTYEQHWLDLMLSRKNFWCLIIDIKYPNEKF